MECVQIITQRIVSIMLEVSEDYQFTPLTLELNYTNEADTQQELPARPKQCNIYGVSNMGTRRHNLDKFEVRRHNGDLLIGLYDGHGVGNTVQYVSIISSEWYGTDLHRAIRQSFRSVDDWILASQSIEDSIDGCVAIVAILRGNSLTIANIGDCRAIKIHQCPFEGIGYDQLSTDHTPENQGQQLSVREKGGLILRVHKCLRINGQLNITRSFGDRRLKKIITSEPDITTYKLRKEDKMVVLGTDGLWSIANSQQVAELAMREYDSKNVAQSILFNLKAKPLDNTTLLCLKL